MTESWITQAPALEKLTILNGNIKILIKHKAVTKTLKTKATFKCCCTGCGEGDRAFSLGIPDHGWEEDSDGWDEQGSRFQPIPRSVRWCFHQHFEVGKEFTPLKYGSYLPEGGKKPACCAELPIQKLTSHSFDSDKQLEGVTSAGSWHNGLRFFVYGSLCSAYAFMCLGRLPRFKVAALKIAGNACGVQVWLKGLVGPVCVVCVRVCAQFHARVPACRSLPRRPAQGSIVTGKEKHVGEEEEGGSVASSEPGTVARTSI